MKCSELLKIVEILRWFFRSLRSRRLEVVGTRKNGRAKRRHARGQRELPHPSRVSLACACSLFRPLLPSACYVGQFFRLSSTRNHILFQNEQLSLLGFLFFRQQTDDKGKNDSIKIVSRGSIPPASGKGSSRAAKMRAMARGEDTASSLKQEQQVR